MRRSVDSVGKPEQETAGKGGSNRTPHSDLLRQDSFSSVFRSPYEPAPDYAGEHQNGALRSLDSESKTENEKVKKKLKWGVLLSEYCSETTMHGVRYLVMNTHFIRRILWAITVFGAVVLFTYLAVSKALYLITNPKGVNVEVNYEESLPFPVVTICNENRYRLSKLFESGAYDILVNRKDADRSAKEPQVGCEKDTYVFYRNVCDKITAGDVYAEAIIKSTTRKVCKVLCSGIYNKGCNGFYYYRDTKTCILYQERPRNLLYPGDHCSIPVEYYKRRRCIKTETVFCDFERRCPLIIDNGWQVVKAQGQLAPMDNTINKRTGHYLYLAEKNILDQTYASSDSDALAMSPYMRTDGKCISFAYWPLGEKPAEIYVSLQTEYRDVTNLLISSPAKNRGMVNDWTWISMELPGDVYKVGLAAKRNYGSTSGIAIDDLEIGPCETLKDRECRIAKTGNDYIGNVSMTASGKPCGDWSEASFLGYSLDLLPDQNLTNSANKCRHIPGLGWKSPMCYVEGEMTKPLACDIPFCDCLPGYFRCISGNCVPESMTCDGYDDCGDNSDESIACGDKLSDDGCDFEDSFQCGWISTESKSFPDWKRHKGPGFSENTSPKTDSRGSKQGYYMYIDSRLFPIGKRMSLTSITLEDPSRMTFYLHMKHLSYENVGKLEIFITNNFGLPQTQLWNSTNVDRTYDNGWIHVEIYLPTGSYRLVFIATAGTPFESDIAIDNIVIRKDNNPLFPTDHDCNTVSKYFPCEIYTMTTNALFDWTPMPSSSVPQLKTQLGQGCNKAYLAQEGTITSPSFPLNYPSSTTCSSIIIMPANSRLVINFDTISLQTDEITGRCLDTLKIDINGTGEDSSYELCTLSRPGIDVPEQSDVRIVFTSDPVIEGHGFSLKYKILDVEDISLVLKTDISGSPEAIPLASEKATLFTGTLFERACLEAEVYITGNINISLIYQGDEGMITENVYRTKTGLGDSWHRIYFQYIQPSILSSRLPSVFIVVMSVKNDLDSFTAIRKLDVTEQCPQPDIAEVVPVCSFEDVGQCGWRDVTEKGSHRWTRIHRYQNVQRKIGNIYSMNVYLVNGISGASIANILHVDQEDVCIKISYQVVRRPPGGRDQGKTMNFDPNSEDKYEFNLNLEVKSSFILETVKLQHGDRGFIKTRLPGGKTEIKLSVNVPDEGFFDEDQYLQLQIDQIEMSSYVCEEKTNPSVECDFEDSKVCGYYAVEWEPNLSKSMGGFMSFGGQDKVGRLVSPDVNFPPSSSLEIRYSLINADLRIYTLAGASIQHHLFTDSKLDFSVPKRENNVNDPAATWSTERICIPEGMFSILFSSSSGENLNAGVNIDYIHLLKEENCTNNQNGHLDQISINDLYCEFMDTTCKYMVYAESPFKWTLTVLDTGPGLVMQKTGLQETIGMSSGYIFSPTLNVSGPVCFASSLALNTYTLVTAIITDGSNKHKRIELFNYDQEDEELIDVVNNLYFEINLDAEETVQFEVMFTYHSYPPLVQMLNGTANTCESVTDNFVYSDNNPFTCNFDFPDICGLRQSISTQTAWLRKWPNEKGNHYIESCVINEHSSFIIPIQTKQVEYMHKQGNKTLIYKQYIRDAELDLDTFIDPSTLKVVVSIHYKNGEIEVYEPPPIEKYVTCETSEPLPYRPGSYIYHIREINMSKELEYITVTVVPLSQGGAEKCIQINQINIESEQPMHLQLPCEPEFGLPRGVVILIQPAVIGYDEVLQDIGGMYIEGYLNSSTCKVPSTQGSITSNTSMETFEEGVGHVESDTMYRCKWHGKDCENDLLTAKQTEIGQCFSFNARGVLSSDLTGAEYGVRMIINTENYEQVADFQQNDGIKVHLHDKVDLENVKNMGFAVAPNDHALVGCKLSTTMSLGPPYSNCSQMKLKHYEGEYSKLRCIREDLIDLQNDTCGCKQPYLPGTFSTCTFLESFNCRNKSLEDSSSTDMVNCPENCTITSYSVELSSGKMSSWSEPELQAIAEKVQAKYHHALELRHRIDENYITKTLSFISDAAEKMQVYVNHLQDLFHLGSTSILSTIVNGVNTLNHLMDKDIKHTLLGKLPSYADFYSIEMYPTIDYVASFLESSSREATFFLDCFMLTSRIDKCVRIIESFNTSLDMVQESLQLMDLKFKDLISSILPSIISMSGRAGYLQCSSVYTMQEVNDRAKEIQISLEGNHAIQSPDTLIDMIKSYITYAREERKCLQAYKLFLSETTTWMKDLAIPTFDRELTLQNEIQSLEESFLKIHEYGKSYLVQERTLLDIASEALGSSDFLEELLDDSVSQSHLTLDPLLSYLSLHDQLLANNMIDAFERMVDWQYYIPTSRNITETAKDSFIWRVPVVDFNNPKIVVTTLNEKQVKRIWTDNQELNSFLGSSGKYLIKDTLRNIIDTFAQEIELIKRQISSEASKVTDSLKAFNLALLFYKNKATIDDNFIRQNFLKMDIYYGELKYEKVQQYRAYDLITYFGDIGGYMGLLLGCSVLTIFELIDLFFYNCCRKCARMSRQPAV